MIRKSKEFVTMLINNAMVLGAMVVVIWLTGSLWPLVLVLAMVGVKDDKDGVR